MSSSRTSLQFLDVLVCQTEGQWHTKLCTKSTDRNTLLRYDSGHPRSMIEALPYSQMLRAKRITDSDEVLATSLDDVEQKFKQ